MLKRVQVNGDEKVNPTAKPGMERGSLRSAVSRGWAGEVKTEEKGERRQVLVLGSGAKYGGPYQDRVPGYNFMGEEKQVNLEKMTWGCLRDIQGGDVPEAFVFPDLYSSEERSELEERICKNQLSGHSQSSEVWMRCSHSMNLF